jgi:hypothetical protein
MCEDHYYEMVNQFKGIGNVPIIVLKCEKCKEIRFARIDPINNVN